MESKNIVFTAVNKAELLCEQVPPLSDGMVMVKNVVSSISSGTERANLTGNLNISCTTVYKEAYYPRRTGYSTAGDVVAVGNGVTSVKVGDRVGVWGSSHHNEYLVVSESSVVKIEDENTPYEEAALWYIGTFPLAAIRKCHLEIGEPAVVMGLGMLGMIAVKLLRLAGAAPVIAVDPVEGKRKQALQNGADFALDPFAEGFADEVKRLTGGGAAVAIEVTGNGKGLDLVLDCMKRFGRVALLGCTRESDFTIDYYRKVHGPGISLIGAHTIARPDCESSHGLWTHRDDICALRTLHACGRLSLSSLIEETYSPNEAPEVYARLVKGGAFPLTQFDWRRLK